jgi:hypothetical protein
MDERLATRLLFVAAALWLVTGSIEVALAATGEPLPPSPINLILFAGESTATLCLLVIRSHRGLAGRLDALAEATERLREEVGLLASQLDYRDGTIYRDTMRRIDQHGRQLVEFGHQLGDMRSWMMRPAVPGSTRARATASVTTVARLEEREVTTQPLPVLGQEWEAEMRGFMAREALEPGDDDQN